VVVAVFVGMILEEYLSLFVIAPQLQKMNINIPGISKHQQPKQQQKQQ